MIKFSAKEPPSIKEDAKQTLCSIETYVEDSLKEFEKAFTHHQRHLTDRSRDLHEDNQRFIEAARQYSHVLEVAGALRIISETGLPTAKDVKTSKLRYPLIHALLDHKNNDPEAAALVPVAKFIHRHKRALEEAAYLLFRAESPQGKHVQRTFPRLPAHEEEQHWL